MSNAKSFIEVQFPVSKISKEAYKERKANLGQTLTGLGKWWGRKPLILVRAAILGLLLPATDNPEKDREIFLKILAMDEIGLLKRKVKQVTVKEAFEILHQKDQEQYFSKKDDKLIPAWKTGITSEEKETALEKSWDLMSYDQKLTYCVRPEEYANEDPSTWKEINNHLGTKANNLRELIEELGVKRFGRIPIVGDCFCGGGSIPFEAARMGCDVFASDLNPIAGLLTWADLNIAGASDEGISKLRKFQQKVYDSVDKQIVEWGIETNEKGERANSYLYCNETSCPECGYIVPLSPSWVIGKGTMTAAILVENNTGFDIQIKSGLTAKELVEVDEIATIKNSSLYCPHCKKTTTITSLRKDNSEGFGLRQWKIDDIIPRNDDIFNERLYCIKYIDKNNNRYYTEPSSEDLKREEKVINQLNSIFFDWQAKGFVPVSAIVSGYNTDQLIRERGWKYWHQLFNPRQLLVHGLFSKYVKEFAENNINRVIGLLGINRLSNWNSKLSQWSTYHTQECGLQTFYNQAFNTFFNYGVRALNGLDATWLFNINNVLINTSKIVITSDARNISHFCHFWITDPPYADAVNYHELSEFFLAWDEKMLPEIFPDWYTDSKRALAVKGTGESFHQSMIQIYQNLARLMPDDGMQIVMFTHQDVSVWADLTLILWSAGLCVTSAWNIATETESAGLKAGNYVKGTVLLVLRKQLSQESAYLDEIYPQIEREVKKQIDQMHKIDDKEEPNFYDPDYLLAAYAASLKVLTSYKKIEDINIQFELSRTRKKGEESPIEKIIYQAVKIAYDYLIPAGFDTFIWKTLIPEERFYLKSLDMEKEGVNQLGAYQELARGFGVVEYKDLLASTKANCARLKTPLEMGMKGIGSDNPFAQSILRNVFASIHQAIKEEDPIKGKNWLKNEIPNYWANRTQIQTMLEYIGTLGAIESMSHWLVEAQTAKVVLELIKNDSL